MYRRLPLPPVDEIVPLMIRAAQDTRSEKVDMTVGVYRDDTGNTPIIEAVRKADQYLAVHRTSKVYVGSFGDAEFVNHIADLSQINRSGKFVKGIQTPGGSSALSLILNLIKAAQPDMKVWVSTPGYANHAPTILSVGLDLGEYPFLNRETMELEADRLLETLNRLGPEDAVVFHGSCHNPSGLELSDRIWRKIAELSKQKGFYPIIDTAYQGLGRGLDADARGLTIMAETVDNLAFSFSCSKNFSLYNDRVGCAFILSSDAREAEHGQIQLAAMARPAHWVPPQNGAELVKQVLSTPALKTQWAEELNAMKDRINNLRQALAEALRVKTDTGKFDYVADNTGLFSLLPATPDQMELLRQKYAVYGLDDGRINIAGLGFNRIEHTAESIAAVIK